MVPIYSRPPTCRGVAHAHRRTTPTSAAAPPKSHFLSVIAASSLVIFIGFGCGVSPDVDNEHVRESGESGTYVGPPAAGTYPADQEDVQRWIDTTDTSRIRQHAWDIWASITSPSGISDLPVWETWYSGHEIFDLAVTTVEKEPGILRDFEIPAQSTHTASKVDIPVDLPERVVSFNRYTRTLADYIVTEGYNRKATLAELNKKFDKAKTPTVDRKLLTSAGPVDASQIVLKPVFQFISGSEPTVVPFWRGVAPAYTTDLDNPVPKTWRQGVVVDPSGGLTPGAIVRMAVNGDEKDLRVVGLDEFYYIRLTQDDAEAFEASSFGFGSGDDVGTDNETTKKALIAVVKAGNIALLVAMHVTTKEIPNWTWQTFWWAFDNQEPPFGGDRPLTVQGAWANYNMRAAYYMVTPPGKVGGDPLISFNPYLETNLTGTVPGPVIDGKHTQIHWTGVHTNCMSCHRMAGYQTQGYQPDGFISPADETFFASGTKTDFLWSIPLRAK